MKQATEMPTSTMALMGLFPVLKGPFFDLNVAFPRFRPKGPFYLLKINNVQTMCIVKGKAQKVHFSGDFWGFLIFSGAPVLLEFHKKTFKFNRITEFDKHPL